jgi:hypothetical protein
MTQEQNQWLSEVVEWARRGNPRAKDALLLILETDRKPLFLWTLLNGDVRPSDLSDGHHNVLVRVRERIEQLRATRAYPRWEDRIINEECRKWRVNYRALVDQIDTAATDGTDQFKENFDEFT